MEDLLVLVDEEDNELGTEEKGKCHLGVGILHRAFSVFIFNEKEELLVQQRSESKMLWPLYWSNTCCSHPRRGEDNKSAAERRLIEECGIKSDLKYLYRFQYRARYENVGSENELCAVFIGYSDGETMKFDPSEVAAFKWISIENLITEMEETPEKFTPWFKMEMKELVKSHFNEIQQLKNINQDN